MPHVHTACALSLPAIWGGGMVGRLGHVHYQLPVQQYSGIKWQDKMAGRLLRYQDLGWDMPTDLSTARVLLRTWVYLGLYLACLIKNGQILHKAVGI